MKGDIFCLHVLEMFLSMSKCVNMKYVFCLPQHVFTFEECLFESFFCFVFAYINTGKQCRPYFSTLKTKGVNHIMYY